MIDTNERSSRRTYGRPVRTMILFVAGSEPNSLEARKNLQKLRAAERECDFDVEFVDVFEDYSRALEHRVLVTPCLVLLEPPPQVRVVGTLKDAEKVRAALRLTTERVPHD